MSKLNNHTVKTLHQIAEDHDLTVSNGLKKDELVATLTAWLKSQYGDSWEFQYNADPDAFYPYKSEALNKAHFEEMDWDSTPMFRDEWDKETPSKQDRMVVLQVFEEANKGFLPDVTGLTLAQRELAKKEFQAWLDKEKGKYDTQRMMTTGHILSKVLGQLNLMDEQDAEDLKQAQYEVKSMKTRRLIELRTKIQTLRNAIERAKGKLEDYDSKTRESEFRRIGKLYAKLVETEYDLAQAEKFGNE